MSTIHVGCLKIYEYKYINLYKCLNENNCHSVSLVGSLLWGWDHLFTNFLLIFIFWFCLFFYLFSFWQTVKELGTFRIEKDVFPMRIANYATMHETDLVYAFCGRVRAVSPTDVRIPCRAAGSYQTTSHSQHPSKYPKTETWRMQPLTVIGWMALGWRAV